MKGRFQRVQIVVSVPAPAGAPGDRRDADWLSIAHQAAMEIETKINDISVVRLDIERTYAQEETCHVHGQ